MKVKLITTIILGFGILAQSVSAQFTQNVSLIDDQAKILLPLGASSSIETFNFYAILGPTAAQMTAQPASFADVLLGYTAKPSGWADFRVLLSNSLPFSTAVVSGTARNLTSVGLSHASTDVSRVVYGVAATGSITLGQALAGLAGADYLGIWSTGALVSSPTAIVKPTVLVNSNNASLSNIVFGEAGSIVLSQIVPVPEPSTFALLGGVLALGFVMWRRRR